MSPKWKAFRWNDRGQDLAEYCLITAAIALIGLVLFINVSGGLQGVWERLTARSRREFPSPLRTAPLPQAPLEITLEIMTAMIMATTATITRSGALFFA